MYKSLIQEYKKQIQKLNNIDSLDAEEAINELNFSIIIDQNNEVNKLLTELLSNKETIRNIKSKIQLEPLNNLIELFINEYNINTQENNNDEVNYSKSNYIVFILKQAKPVYTFEEEQQAFKELKNGNKKMINEIISHNYRLVLKISSKYSNHFFSKEELFNIGILGLRTAILKFDYTRGIKFSTYAIHWIKQAITRDIYNKSTQIRIPVGKYLEIAEYNKWYNQLYEELNRIPNEIEIAEKSGLTLEKIKTIKNDIHQEISLEAPIGEDKITTLGEMIPDNTSEEIIEKNLEAYEIQEIIHTAIKSPRTIKIIEMRYGIGEYKYPRTLNEIGKELNITRERTRQIANHALTIIRKELIKKYNLNKQTKKLTKKNNTNQ